MVHRPNAPRSAAQTSPVQPATVHAMTARSRADPPTRIVVCSALRRSWLRRTARSTGGETIPVVLARKIQELTRQAGEGRLRFGRLRYRTANVARGKTNAGGEDAVDRALAKPRRKPADKPLANDMLDHAVGES